MTSHGRMRHAYLAIPSIKVPVAVAIEVIGIEIASNRFEIPRYPSNYDDGFQGLTFVAGGMCEWAYQLGPDSVLQRAPGLRFSPAVVSSSLDMAVAGRGHEGLLPSVFLLSILAPELLV